MTRNTFAGATCDLLDPAVPGGSVGGTARRSSAPPTSKASPPNASTRCDLRDWLRNAPAKKPMYADPEKLEETDGMYRGMPYLALSEDQIDDLRRLPPRTQVMGTR